VGGALAGPVTTSDFYSLRDMISMVKGKHSLVYGAEFALDKGMFSANLYNFGVFSFQSSAPTSTDNGQVVKAIAGRPIPSQATWHDGPGLLANALHWPSNSPGDRAGQCSRLSSRNQPKL
jgi:hypothetical protein